MQTDSIFPRPICLVAIATTALPILVAVANGLTPLATLAAGLATLATYTIIWLYLAAKAFRGERNLTRRYYSRMRNNLAETEAELKRANIGIKVRQRLLDEMREETNDLNDRVADLEVTNSKVGTQQELLKRCQKRIGRLNTLIETGREPHSATTLEDVYRLTGEIETPEPTFKDIERLEEEDV